MMILAVTVAITWMEVKIAVNMKIKHTHKKKQAAAEDASLKKQYKANKINNKIN